MSESMSKLPFSFMLQDTVDFLIQSSVFELFKEMLQLASCDSSSLTCIHSSSDNPYVLVTKMKTYIYRMQKKPPKTHIVLDL